MWSRSTWKAGTVSPKGVAHWNSSRLSRRKILVGGGAGALSLALAACGGDKEDTSSSNTDAASGDIKRGGTLLWGGSAGSAAKLDETLDPFKSVSGAGTFFAWVGENAVRPSQDGKEIQGVLVEKWEIPGDGTEIVLSVRPNVRWHNKAPVNGRTVTAEDIAFNMNTIAGILDPQNKSAYVRRATMTTLERATATGPLTVNVKLSRPHSSFFYGLGMERNYIVPQELVDAQAGKWNDPLAIVGTGPWIFDSFQDGVKASVKPNPDYWQSGKPYIGSVQFANTTDRLSLAAAFGQGQVEFYDRANKVERETIQKTAKNAVELSWTYAQQSHFQLNLARKPFDDERVRQALQLVFQYKVWGDNYYGADSWSFTSPCSVAFPEAFSSDEISKRPGYNMATKADDVKKAKDLLSAAGFPDGNFGFKILAPSTQPSYDYKDNAIRAIDDLKRTWPSMDVAIDLAPDQATFQSRSAAHDFDMWSYGVASQPSAVLDMFDIAHTGGGKNYSGLKDATIDALLDKAATQFDLAERTATMKQVQTMLLTSFPIIATDSSKSVNYISSRIRDLRGGLAVGGGTSRDLAQNMKDAWLAS